MGRALPGARTGVATSGLALRAAGREPDRTGRPVLRLRAPKVLLLLTGGVFALGFVRTFFSAERTREAPANRSLFTENVLTSLLGVVTPFRSCSAVPVLVLIGVPHYSNAAGIFLIIHALLEQGASLGTVLAFMMSVLGLSLPEMAILRKGLKLPLILRCVGVVASGIIAIGYPFNLLARRVPPRKPEEPRRWEMWLLARPRVSTRGPSRDLAPGTS